MWSLVDQMLCLRDFVHQVDSDFYQSKNLTYFNARNRRKLPFLCNIQHFVEIDRSGGEVEQASYTISVGFLCHLNLKVSGFHW